MSLTYILWSGRSQGWFSNGNYTTDLAQAQHFSREEAIAFCRRHKLGGHYNLLPVVLDDLEAI